MKYVVDHIPRNTPCNRRPGIGMSVASITIHNTGNPNSTARNERAWLTNPTNNRTASYHIVVDEREAIECLPLHEVGWHAGDGSSPTSGNRTSIGIEICESGNYALAVENAAKLTAQLLCERGWGIDRLRRHWDWSRKVCPRKMYDNGTWQSWEGFKKQVKDELTKLNKEEENILELTNYQRTALATALKQLFDQKIITDKSWIDKAEKGTLTVSELTWLNTIVLSRKSA